MLVGEQIIKDGLSNGDILKLFKEAQKELIAIIESMEAGSTFGSFRREQVRVIDRVIDRLDERARRWAERELPKIMNAGAKETYQAIKDFGEREFAVSFAGVPEEMVNVFVEEAWADFGTTMVGLNRSMKRAALERRRMQERIFKGFVQGASRARTQRDLLADLKKRGVTVLRAGNGAGRRWSLEDYTDMLIRTQNVTAYSLGAKNQMLASGRRYAIFPKLSPDIDGPDVCNVWERKKYIDLLHDPLPPQSTHPRCRHVPQPVSFEQLKRERPDLYEKAIRYARESV